MPADTTQKIITALNNVQTFNLIKDIISNEHTLIACNNNIELFDQLIQYPDIYGAIIMSATQDNLSLLRNINTCSKTKIIPVIIQTDDALSDEEINTYIRAGARYSLPATLATENVKTILLAAISDRKRHLAAGNNLFAEQSSLTMQSAEFKFQRLDECQSLASFFASACPNPRLAVIGIIEILINAIEHGNLGISYIEKTNLQSSDNWIEEVERRIQLPQNINKYAQVLFYRTKEYLELHIKDAGDGFDWDKFQYLDFSRVHDSHGRGIIMAKNLAFERLEYSAKGNEVHCFIKLGG